MYAVESLNQEAKEQLEIAAKILHDEKKTCVAIGRGDIYRSELRGVAPILDRMEEEKEYFCGCVVADKVIGKSAAMLLILSHVKAIYADVISEHAIKALEQYQVPYAYDQKVGYIQNRTEDGMCPMEQTVLKENDPERAFTLLSEKRKLMRSSQNRSKCIALTFDDGPNLPTTGEVLDVLEQYGIPGTFFMEGQKLCEQTIPIIRRGMEMGCEYENHSKTHPAMTALSVPEFMEEYTYTSDKIEEITGRRPKFFRPPYIAIDERMFEHIDATFICGYGASDWIPTVNEEDRARRLAAQVCDGAILLLHDQLNNIQSVDALKILIPQLLEEGYRFMTLEKLFEEKKVIPDHQKMYMNVLQTDLYIWAKMWKILSMDCYCVDVFPTENNRVVVGGNALNHASAVVNTGLATSYAMGRVGTDSYGKKLLDACDTLGINREHLSVCEGATANHVIQIDENGDRYFNEGSWTGGVYDTCTVTEEDEKFLNEMDAVATTVNDPAFTKIVKTARQGNFMLAVDFQDAKADPEWEQYLDAIDLFFISGREEDFPILQRWSEQYDCVFTATLGAAGSIVYYKGKEYRCNAVPVNQVIDTTGCGDSYQGAFLANYLNDRDIEYAMKAGSVSAARTLGYVGGVDVH